MRVGYFYMNKFASWVSQNCAFSLADDDLSYILVGLNRGHKQCVHKEDFLKSVNAEDVVSEVEKAESSVVEAEEEKE